MAKMNIFREYGAKKQNETPVDDFVVTLEDLTTPQEEVAPQAEIAVPTTAASRPVVNASSTEEDFADKPKSNRGRPKVNVGMKLVPKTYRLPEEVVDAIEEKFFQNRRKWEKGMSYSKYIANLVWKDVHGENLFHPETGEPLQ